MNSFGLPELQLPVRKRIFEVVSKFPGLHFREVQRRTGLATGSLEYHLDVLERAGTIKVEKRLFRLRLYPVDVAEGEAAVLSLIRQGNYRKTLLFLLKNPQASQGRIADFVRISPSTMSWYLKRLLDMQIVKSERNGRETRYSIVDYQMVARTLSTFRSSFSDRAVDNFLKTWEGLFD